MNILKDVKKIEQEIISWRRDLHKIPELNLTLPKTSQYVQEKNKKTLVFVKKLQKENNFSLIPRLDSKISFIILATGFST